MSAQTRLATYGTLAPGRINHHQLSSLRGHWFTGHVCGTLVEAGWGAEHGYPGLIIEPAGSAIEVHVFESPELPDHWPRLDEFEGTGYRRVVTTVAVSSGSIEASIYVINA